MRKTRIAVALVAAASLCLGPAAAAFAEEGNVAEAAARVEAQEAAAPAVEAAPAAEPVAEPAAEPAPVVDPAPVAAPDAEPAPAAADPAPTTADEPVASEPAAPSSAKPAASKAAKSANTASSGNTGNKGNNGNNGNANPGESIGICHATGNPNHFVYNEPNKNGVESGHAGMSHQDARDVIPPFTYIEDGVQHSFGGQNWDSSLATELNNWITVLKCAGPKPTPPVVDTTPTITVTSESPCLVDEYGALIVLDITAGNLVAGKSYIVQLKRGTNVVKGFTFTATGATHVLSQSVSSAGSYSATITGPGDAGSTVASSTLVVTKCVPEVPETPMPTIVLSSGLCLTEGEAFAVTAILESLVEGETYTVVLTQGTATVGSASFTADATGMKELQFPITAGGDFTATVTGPGESGAYASDSITVQTCTPGPRTDIPPTIEVTSEDACLPEGELAQVGLIVTLGDLMVGDDYTLTVTGPGVSTTTSITADAPTMQLTIPVTTSGVFTLTIEGSGYEAMSDTAEYVVSSCGVINPCETGGESESADSIMFLEGVFGDGENDTVRLDANGDLLRTSAAGVAAAENPEDECDETPSLQVVIGECSTTDEAVAVTLEAMGLREAVEYGITVTGPAGFTWSGTITGDAEGFGSAEALLGAPGVYVATLDGAEPVEFVSAVSCAETTPPIVPAVVTKPKPKPAVVTPPPALAVTGSTGTEGFVWIAAIALILAGGLMVGPRIARGVKR